MYKRRRKANRLTYYDYSQNGYYFVTICTWGNSTWFGKIRNDKVVLSKIGKVVDQCWMNIPNHFQNIKLDEYVIMPNHMHGIIIINFPVGNRHACSLHRQYQKLPCIIGSFKSAVTKHARKVQPAIHFQWQKSYYDHIIRNAEDLNRIRQYIRNNPLKWHLDRNHLGNM